MQGAQSALFSRLSLEGQWECWNMSASGAWYGRQRGSCRHPSFSHKTAFDEAVPFLSHLSSRFSENNLDFTQQQMPGICASLYPLDGQATMGLGFCFPAVQRARWEKITCFSIPWGTCAHHKGVGPLFGTSHQCLSLCPPSRYGHLESQSLTLAFCLRGDSGGRR